MDVLDGNASTLKVQIKVCEVPYAAYPRARELCSHIPGVFLLHAQHGHVRTEFTYVLDGLVGVQNGDGIDLRANKFRKNIEGGNHIKAALVKIEVLDEGSAQVAYAEKYGFVITGGAEYLGDLIAEIFKVISVALEPELAEAAEVLTYLGRGKPELL